MEKLSDMALTLRVAATGNQRAFEALVLRHQEEVRRFFMHQTLGDKELSDDLAQDTFLKAWLALPRFRGVASFSTWLYRIACNVLYDHMRRQRPMADISSAEAVQSHSETQTTALRMDIFNALARLDSTERLCVTLQLVDGQSVKAISNITRLSENTVKSHLKRGKEKLSKYLKENGYE